MLMWKLKNGNKEELTMDEARELYDELHQIFSKPEPLPVPNTLWPHVKPLNPWEIIGDGQPFYAPVICGPAKGVT